MGARVDPYKSKVSLAFGSTNLAFVLRKLTAASLNLDFDKIYLNFGHKYPFDNDHVPLRQGLALVQV